MVPNFYDQSVLFAKIESYHIMMMTVTMTMMLLVMVKYNSNGIEYLMMDDPDGIWMKLVGIQCKFLTTSTCTKCIVTVRRTCCPGQGHNA